MKKVSFLIVLFILCCVCTKVFAQAGSLDTSFGINGKVTGNLVKTNANLRMCIQNDGKKVVSCEYFNGNDYDIALCRYLPDGGIDSSFGTNGVSITDVDSSETARGLALQTDGKILVSAFSVGQQAILLRYNTDGSLDNTFGNGGVVNAGATGGFVRPIAIQADGKILLAGETYNIFNNTSDLVLTRYQTNGSVDASFGNAGTQQTGDSTLSEYVADMQLQADGKILVCGKIEDGNFLYDVLLLRYQNNGLSDSSFGVNGQQRTALDTSCWANAMAIQTDGKIVIGATTGALSGNVIKNKNFALIRYLPDANLDNNFGNGGIMLSMTDSTDDLGAICIQADGKILICGRTKVTAEYDVRLNRYLSNGTPDNSFGNNGIVYTDFNGNDWATAMAIQNDGKIVVAGFYNPANNPGHFLARYHDLEDVPAHLGTTSKDLLLNYPNPFSASTQIKTDAIMVDASIILYDISGRQVRRMNHLNGNSFTLHRNNLAAGQYTFAIFEGNMLKGKGQLIINSND